MLSNYIRNMCVWFMYVVVNKTCMHESNGFFYVAGKNGRRW